MRGRKGRSRYGGTVLSTYEKGMGGGNGTGRDGMGWGNRRGGSERGLYNNTKEN